MLLTDARLVREVMEDAFSCRSRSAPRRDRGKNWGEMDVIEESVTTMTLQFPYILQATEIDLARFVLF